MPVEALRLKNFMAFPDTGWIEFSPISLLMGKNSSGKSVVIRALRLLKQSVDQSDPLSAFQFSSEHGINIGDFATIVHKSSQKNNARNKTLSIAFRCVLPAGLLSMFEFQDQPLDYMLNYVWNARRKTVDLSSFLIKLPQEENHNLLFSAQYSSRTGEWVKRSSLSSELRLPHVVMGIQKGSSDGEANFSAGQLWKNVKFVAERGFLPKLQPIRGSMNDLFSSKGNVSGFDNENLLHDENSELEVEKAAVIKINKFLLSINTEIINFLQAVEYIEPVRPAPQRLYILDQFEIDHWQKRGLGSFIRFLSSSSEKEGEIFREISEWMFKFGAARKIVTNPIVGKNNSVVVSEIDFLDHSSGIKVNIADVGFGISQILPIIAASYFSSEGSLIVIEQPELHLHPDAQAILADFLIERANSGRLFLVETHSEHILLRIQRRVVETLIQKSPLANEQITNEGFALATNQARVFFIQRANGASFIEKLSFDEYGEFVSPSKEFLNFFVRDYEDVVHFEKASSMLKRYRYD